MRNKSENRHPIWISHEAYVVLKERTINEGGSMADVVDDLVLRERAPSFNDLLRTFGGLQGATITFGGEIGAEE